MYYYGGYSGGYGNSCGCCSPNNMSYGYPMMGYGYGYSSSYGSSAAIVLVLFILLVIIIGSRVTA